MTDPFYANGLRFSCTRCSGCCRGESGHVFLSNTDLKRLLARLSLDFKSFFSKYCRLIDIGTGMAMSLREVDQAESRTTVSHNCVLWGAEGCFVYEDRPVQCSTYPFWSSIMDSMDAWVTEARYCSGIGAGELRSNKYIEDLMLMRRGAGMIILRYGVDPECVDENTILGS